MIKLLIKLFIRENDDLKNHKTREKYILLSGFLGIFCNLLLFFTKLFTGLFINSIAVVSDAFNNFSDMGTSLVAIIGAKLSNQGADKEHPFGHGRMEYVSSLIISFIIILVGFELLKSSAIKLFHPEPSNSNIYAIIILCTTIFIKLWMFSYNRYIGKRINSGVVLNLATDSLNDIISSIAVIMAVILNSFTAFDLDSIFGVAVSVVIILSGIKMAKEHISALLGSPPEEKTVSEIERLLLENDEILGIHDLTLHDYGPGRIMGSVHAEVDEACRLITIHEVIDKTEAFIEEALGIHLVIHIDPVETGSLRLSEAKDFLSALLSDMDDNLSFHDLRIVYRDNKANLLFDLCIPVGYKEYRKNEIVKKITDKITEWDGSLNTVIKIDNKF